MTNVSTKLVIIEYRKPSNVRREHDVRDDAHGTGTTRPSAASRSRPCVFQRKKRRGRPVGTIVGNSDWSFPPVVGRRAARIEARFIPGSGPSSTSSRTWRVREVSRGRSGRRPRHQVLLTRGCYISRRRRLNRPGRRFAPVELGLVCHAILPQLLQVVLVPLDHDVLEAPEVNETLAFSIVVSEDLAVELLLRHRQITKTLEDEIQCCLILVQVDESSSQRINPGESLLAECMSPSMAVLRGTRLASSRHIGTTIVGRGRMLAPVGLALRRPSRPRRGIAPPCAPSATATLSPFALIVLMLPCARRTTRYTASEIRLCGLAASSSCVVGWIMVSRGPLRTIGWATGRLSPIPRGLRRALPLVRRGRVASHPSIGSLLHMRMWSRRPIRRHLSCGATTSTSRFVRWCTERRPAR